MTENVDAIRGTAGWKRVYWTPVDDERGIHVCFLLNANESDLYRYLEKVPLHRLASQDRAIFPRLEAGRHYDLSGTFKPPFLDEYVAHHVPEAGFFWKKGGNLISTFRGLFCRPALYR